MFKSHLLGVFLLLTSVAASVTNDDTEKKHQPAWMSEIKHFVWLAMENRSPDNLFGGMTYTKDIDVTINNRVCYPVNVSDPNDHRCIFPQEHDHDSVIQDPAHGASDTFFELFGTFNDDLDAIHSGEMKPNMRGYLTMQRMIHGNENVTDASDAINFYRPEDIPTLTALASTYTFFDRWFQCVVGPTNPNRACLTSGTSEGHGANDDDYNNFAIPSRSIFQVFDEQGITWRNYGSTGGPPDANFYSWTKETGRDQTNVFGPDTDGFFNDINNHNLSTLTYLNPTCCDAGTESMHPNGLVSDGEAYLKKIYDALRGSEYWEKTLWIITFDESGGFADHVPPVPAPRPDNLTYTETARDGSTYVMDFSFTGPRVPTLLVSPWVPKGHVEHKGKNNGKEYTATSILKFLDNFFGLPDLTPRVTWSSTWEHLMLDKPRKDTPLVLPPPKGFTQG